MPYVFFRRPVSGLRWAGRLVFCLCGGLMLAGCEEEGIRQYSAPKAEASENVRLFGVIYPHGDLTWFFKLMGPESAVDEQANALDDFLKSVHLTDQGDHPIEWKLPQGWQPVASAKANGPETFATLRMTSKDNKTLDLTVTKFPGDAGGVLANVNRWRRQVGLTPIAAAELEKATTKVAFNGDTAVTVSLIGPGVKAGGARTPFLEMPGGAGDKTPFHYTKPEGWEDSPNLMVKGIKRAAVFKASDGDQTVEISVTPLAGDGGGLAANVDRWRGQVGLQPAAEIHEQDFPKVDAAGAAGPLIDLVSDDGRQRILGVLVAHGGATWVFKMNGPAGVVEKNKARFLDFLKSVQFDGDKGGDQ